MAGTLFAVEILLYDLEVNYLSHIIIAAVTGTMTTRLLYGAGPIFNIPNFVLSHPLELLNIFRFGAPRRAFKLA